MIILRVGDPHVKPNNIDEADALMNFVVGQALKFSPHRIEILGDLFHTHSILRLEVIEFWDNWLEHLADICETIVLVGNHDQSGDYGSASNALSVFKHIKNKKLKIVENARHEGIFAYLAYHHDHKELVLKANNMAALGAKVLVCHQTFDGSKYESGMYAPDGIDPALFHYDLIISGHIHSTQTIISPTQTVIYPGTAKWDTASDANESKGIWLYEHNDVTGAITKVEMLPTNEVCTPIISVIWNEGEPMPELPEKAKASVELIGSGDWVTKNKAMLKGKVSVKSKITDKANKERRQAGNSFLDFMTNLYDHVERANLLEYAKELKIV